MNLRRIDDDSGAKTTSPFLEAKSAPTPAAGTRIADSSADGSWLN